MAGPRGGWELGVTCLLHLTFIKKEIYESLVLKIFEFLMYVSNLFFFVRCNFKINPLKQWKGG